MRLKVAPLEKKRGIVKSYLKEQGLSEDEMKEALKAYKETKANKVKEEQERINKIIKKTMSTRKRAYGTGYLRS